MSRLPRGPLHVVRFDDRGSHRNDRLCPCAPSLAHVVTDSDRLVFIHRSPPVSERVIRTRRASPPKEITP